MRSTIKKFYLWFLSIIKPKDMSVVRDTIFHEQSQFAKERLQKLKEYIKKRGEGYYIKVQDVGDEDLEIIMGKKKFLLEYSIDLLQHKTIFITSQILKSESNYGSYKQTLISDISFEIDQYNDAFFRAAPAFVNEEIKRVPMNNFAHDYFSKLEGLFTIV